MDKNHPFYFEVDKFIEASQKDLTTISLKNLKKLYDEYESLIKSSSNTKNIDCKLYCNNCCKHWVEDLYAFEVHSIIHHIKKHFDKETIEKIKNQSIEDEELLTQIYNQDPDIDTDLLLLKFMELDRLCPLINKDGLCSIYEVRPLTCRSYFSNNSELCKPSKVFSDETGGPFVFSAENDAENKLDDLHFSYEDNEITSLRSLLALLL